MRRNRGYIMFEAVMAMMLLSLGTIAIQSALQQAIQTRGQARDYTQARLLLDQVIAELELQPVLREGERKGRFKGDLDRFQWKTKVNRVDLPEPEVPSDLDQIYKNMTELKVKYLAKISATVSWERGGRQFEETFNTLWLSDKLYAPRDVPKGLT